MVELTVMYQRMMMAYQGLSSNPMLYMRGRGTSPGAHATTSRHPPPFLGRCWGTSQAHHATPSMWGTKWRKVVEHVFRLWGCLPKAVSFILGGSTHLWHCVWHCQSWSFFVASLFLFVRLFKHITYHFFCYFNLFLFPASHSKVRELMTRVQN